MNIRYVALPLALAGLLLTACEKPAEQPVPVVVPAPAQEPTAQPPAASDEAVEKEESKVDGEATQSAVDQTETTKTEDGAPAAPAQAQ